jgi:hypothetical protein
MKAFGWGEEIEAIPGDEEDARALQEAREMLADLRLHLRWGGAGGVAAALTLRRSLYREIVLHGFSIALADAVPLVAIVRRGVRYPEQWR